MTFWKWSKTAGDNDDADSNVNWRESMAPSAVNNSARAMMAALAKYRDDLSGNLVTGGTETAYTLTTNQVLATLTDGFAVAARMNATNGASPTLSVDSLTAKPIQSASGTAVASGQLLSGGVYIFVYDSGADAWIVHSIPQNAPEFASGVQLLFPQAAPPTGWTLDTDVTDSVIRVNDTAGAGTGGSWTISGVTVDGHTLTVDEMPAHAHAIPTASSVQDGSSKNVTGSGTSSGNTASTGGGSSHSHGLTADGTWRPAYLDVVKATKD